LSVTVAMLICIQCRIYLQWYIAKSLMCLELTDCSRLSQWMQKIILRPFLANIFTLKTVLQSAPEHAIFIQNIEKFSGEGARSPPQTPLPAEGGHPSRNHPLGAVVDPRAFGARPLPPPLRNPRYATDFTTKRMWGRILEYCVQAWNPAMVKVILEKWVKSLKNICYGNVWKYWTWLLCSREDWEVAWLKYRRFSLA